MALLTVEALRKELENRSVVNEISFSIDQGEQLAIVGETGSGKTTLLKMLGGLIQPDAGIIIFDNEKVKGPDEVLIAGHKKIGYLSQHFELRNNYRVHDILSMASRMEEDTAQRILQICKIDHLQHRWSDELSGGEKQRIALARILLAAPQLLLLDEPFSNLDASHKKLMQAVLHELSEEFQLTCILVSHDATDILSWAQQILVLQGGRQVQHGSPREIYYEPRNEYVASLTGNYNMVSVGHPLFNSCLAAKGSSSTFYVRPERVKLFASGKFALEGTIKLVRFMGSHYLVHVQVGAWLVLATSPAGNYSPGDAVSISVEF